jgi:hypothetical protein
LFAFGPYSWLTPALVALGVVLVVVVVALIWRGRDEADRRPGPVTYFLYGLSLVCLLVMLVGTGIGVHATAQAIGPSSSFPSPGGFPNLQPCPTNDTTTPTTPTTTIPSDQLPCINFGQSNSNGESASSGQSESSGQSDSSGLTPVPSAASGSFGYSTLFANISDRNSYISAAVTAGLFALAGLIGFLLFWPRARRVGGDAEDDQGRVRRFGLAYGYLVSALSAVALLVFVPLAVDNVFRAIAPGVNNASGHGDGVRGFATFAVLSALAAIALVYHLRYANRLREAPPSPDLPPPPD